jgi:hypothetical protein
MPSNGLLSGWELPEEKGTPLTLEPIVKPVNERLSESVLQRLIPDTAESLEQAIASDE